jgi:threonine dehydrogenase-like Zn-dependent dehydrogenase
VRAITVRPGTADSGELSEVPEPEPGEGEVLVEALALGVCGTDGEILRGDYGEAPAGADRLVLGHESLGRVLEAPDGAHVASGDLVVGIVRRPDPVPCPCCAAGQWDMCRNGRYSERGIKSLHGYGSERWRVEPDFCVRLDPGLASVGALLEPTSVVAKAWEEIDRVAERACFGGERVLVTGAGPVGLLGALLAVQRGYEVHVLDRATEGAKPTAVGALGATFHGGAGVYDVPAPDVVLEATGAGPVVFDAMCAVRANGIVCLTGLSPAGRRLEVDAGMLNQEMVLENNVVVGSVNARREHYTAAADALAVADRAWLERLITRRVPLESWPDALERRPDDIKTIVDFQAA